ncbi:MAG TPA: hypothetical protein VNK23_04905 [Candidatus Dormibacteraeota bacterium]|nr:hypothetical protein [Candidatus Dormibacteraeota bacterium]
MIDSRARSASQAPAWQIGTLLAAGFFILVGIVFQLAQFGYDGLVVRNFWFISMIISNVWSFLATRADLPALGDLLRFWPMLLVATGLALLALPYSTCAEKFPVAQARINSRD